MSIKAPRYSSVLSLQPWTNTGNKRPTATISVVGGATAVVAGQTVSLNLAGVDTDGTIAKLEVLDNGLKIGEILSASGVFQTAALTAGAHSFTARAVDNAGATGTSLAVLVSATAPGGTTPFSVATNAQRQTVVTPATGDAATDYEYQFRPAPTATSRRQVDISSLLAEGESITDYEIQLR